MSTSRSVGDRAQVDAVNGPSSSSVAIVTCLKHLHIGAKLELAMLVGVNDWETKNGARTVVVKDSTFDGEVVELGGCFKHKGHQHLQGHAVERDSMVQGSDVLL